MPNALNRRRATVAGVLIFLAALLFLGLNLFRTGSKLVKAKTDGQACACKGRLEALSIGLMEVVGNTGRFPYASNWCDVTLVSGVAGANGFETNPRRAFRCPAGSPSQPCHYAFNSKLSGVPADRVHPSTIVLFETDGGWNLSGGPELLLSRPRHGLITVLLANSHVATLSNAQALTGFDMWLANRPTPLQWDP